MTVQDAEGDASEASDPWELADPDAAARPSGTVEDARAPERRPLMSRFRDAVLGPRTPSRDNAQDVFDRLGRAERGQYSALQFDERDEPEQHVEAPAPRHPGGGESSSSR